jgi:hypothetical protein
MGVVTAVSSIRQININLAFVCVYCSQKVAQRLFRINSFLCAANDNDVNYINMVKAIQLISKFLLVSAF